MTTPRLCIASFVVCFLLTLGPSETRSQIADDLSNLGEAIARNAELLVTAKELVSETNSIKARASLEAAARLHAESVNYFRKGPGGGNLLRAAQLAKHAREAILQTISLAKREAKLEQNAIKAMERAGRRLEQVKSLLAESRDRDVLPARRLAEEARGLVRRARDNMNEHLFEVALRLATSSEQLSSRAVAMLKRDFSDVESIEKELEKTDRVIERAGEQLDEDAPPPARRMFEEAKELQLKAKNSYRGDKPRVALEFTRRARNLAMRALKMLASRAGRENVEQALHLTDMLILEANEMLAGRDAPRLRRRVEQAEELQRQARTQLERGNYERALKLSLKARKILGDALSSVRQALDEGEVRAALVKTDELLDRAGNALGDDRTAAELYDRARVNQETAWREFRDGRLRAALAHTKLARRLARGAMRRLTDDES